MNQELVTRPDGKIEERLADIWSAEYAQDAETGLWEVVVFKHDVAEWRGEGYASIQDAQAAAHERYHQE